VMRSETRAGSMPARSSAALMAMAPRSWAEVVANAPLKLPTGVRAALTMTTSSDMDISYLFFGLVFLTARGPGGGPVLIPILLSSLRHVNRPRSEKLPRRIQIDRLGSFLSSPDALG